MGDFQANFRRPKDSGIHTVEGNVAGARAASLVRQREKDQEAYEAQVAATKKQKMATLQTTMKFNAKFSSSGTTTSTTNTAEFAKKNSRNIITTAITEESFLDATVGLVTAEEFKRLQKAKDDFFANDNEQSRALCINSSLKDIQAEKDEMTREKEQKMARKRKVKEKRRQMATLSFADSTDNPIEDDNDEVFITNSASTGIATTKSAIATGGVVAPLINKKDPSVNTSFLPDRERERIARETRERLEQEWKEQQQVLQNEPLEIVYSYWDGSGHRRSIQCRKGDTIGMFLEAVRKELANEFRELTSIGSDALIYVKEDLMLPHDLTFYDLIVSKARGKSGPLFHFDVHDDVRLGAIDVRMEKDESHPGKIVQRHWYERNKHIFPASRWEHFDPAKDYGNYTIGGKTVQH